MNLQVLRRLSKTARLDNFNKNANRFKEIYLHSWLLLPTSGDFIVTYFIIVMNFFGYFSKQCNGLHSFHKENEPRHSAIVKDIAP